MSTIKVDSVVNKSGDSDSGINLGTNDTVKFDIAGSTKWTLNSSGHLVPSSASQGIVLGATSDGVANRLDDYEYGTWTATFTGSTGAPSSAQTATGLYTKIGRLCTVGVYSAAINTSGASGNLKVTGLPFTSHSSCQSFGSYISYNIANSASNVINHACWIWGNISHIDFYENTDAGAWSTTQISAGSTRYLALSITYETA